MTEKILSMIPTKKNKYAGINLSHGPNLYEGHFKTLQKLPSSALK